MSHVPHPPSGTFLRHWFPHLRPRPKMAPPLGECRDGSQTIGPPLGDSDETNMSHVPHPPGGTFLRPWFDHLSPWPKMAPPVGGAEMGLGLYARPLGDSDESNMSHVPHPPSGTFLSPWFDHLRPRPKMAPPRGVPRLVWAYRPAPGGQ